MRRKKGNTARKRLSLPGLIVVAVAAAALCLVPEADPFNGRPIIRSSSLPTPARNATWNSSTSRGRTFAAAVLNGANLGDTDLTFTNLYYSNMEGASLKTGNLSGANLKGANLKGANFTGANLYDADLSEANLTGANFTGANLVSAKLFSAVLSKTVFTNANLSRAVLSHADANLANFAGANLNKVIIKWARLCGEQFFPLRPDCRRHGREPQILRANFYCAKMRNARATGADFLKASLAQADMTGGVHERR